MFNEVLELFIKYLNEYKFNAADMYLSFQWEHCYITDDQQEFLYYLKEVKDKRDEISWNNLFLISIKLNIPVYRKNDLKDTIMIVFDKKKYYI